MEVRETVRDLNQVSSEADVQEPIMKFIKVYLTVPHPCLSEC